MRLLLLCCSLLLALPAVAVNKTDIVTMQRQLNAMGYSIADNEGRIGKDTKQALTLFREDNNLPRRQWLDAALAETITERYVAMYRARGEAVPKAPRTAGANLGKYCVVTSGSLELANSDKKIQTQLAELGYRPGNIVGRFSSETRAAISTFQLDNDLRVTGKADKLTRQLLLAAVSQLRTNRRRADELATSE